MRLLLGVIKSGTSESSASVPKGLNENSPAF